MAGFPVPNSGVSFDSPQATVPLAGEVEHLLALVDSLRREVQDLRAATEIVVYDIGCEYVALAGRGTGFGERVNEAIGDLVRSHPGRFNIVITEKTE